MNIARGTFEVIPVSHPPYDAAPGATIGRTSLTKTFAGDLVGTSTAEMIGARTSTPGSAGYVAIERVTCSLASETGPRTGTFVLQHSGTMARGAMNLSCTVVPDSGTDDLVGIEGAVAITIVDRQHFYAFEWGIRVAGT